MLHDNVLALQNILGLNPFVFHLNNILLHIMTAILVLVLGRRMGLSEKGAFLAALVFALHPMKVESVAWVTERKDVLSGVFYVGSLIFYWDYLKSDQGKKYIFALLCGIASILAKPMSLSLPLVFLLMDRMISRRWTLGCALDKLPFVLTLWPIAGVTAILYTRPHSWDLLSSTLLLVYSSTFYIAKFLFPTDLSAVYLIPKPITLQTPEYALSFMILMLILWSGYIFRHSRWFIFALVFYILTMFFLWRVDAHHALVVSERFMYIPSIGFCFLIGAGLDKSFFNEKLKQGRSWLATSLLCALLAGMTFNQCFIWQDSLVFWNAALQKNPNYTKGLNNRAQCLLVDKDVAYRYKLDDNIRYRVAAQDLDRAININDKDPSLWQNLGNSLRGLGYIKESKDAYAKAKKLRETTDAYSWVIKK